MPDGSERPLQINFCKNPRCANFGVPPALTTKHARRSSAGQVDGLEYRLVASGAGLPTLKCLLCGEHLPLKSNSGVAEEWGRIANHLQSRVNRGCPTKECTNSSVPAPNSDAFFAFGRTEAGSARYQCKRCRRTFSIAARTTLRQREPRKNVPILKSLMNKMPLSRIADNHDVSIQTVYDKLDFFSTRTTEFAAKHEAVLPALVRGTKRYLATDRQDYAVNWTHRKDKRNVVLRAIGTADLDSGFVFGMHINFDGALDAPSVEKDAQACGDYENSQPHRKYARLWLTPDYAKAVEASAARASKRLGGVSLGDEIRKRYADAEARADVESPELVRMEERFPANGMQVRNEYTMYAHFFYLHQLLAPAEKLRFFMDQESGIRAACLAAFKEEISARKADAFFVRLEKEITVDEKRKIIKLSRDAFKEMCKRHPELSESEVKALMMRSQIATAAEFGKWSDRWAVHPFPNQSEPQKAMCYLTDFDDYDDDHKARLYLKASLHPIDRFFMQIRRRLNMLERPISTSSKAGRTWYGYSAYQPANIAKLLTVFRVFYNFSVAGADRKTPAMRLGLAQRIITPAELLGQ